MKYLPSQRAGLRQAAISQAVRSVHRTGVSRRQFLQGAAGLSAVAATLGVPRSATAGQRLILPIPTTLDIFGQPFHVQAPPFTGADSDPSSVYNFEGAAAIAFISGSVQRIDRRTGESQTLPFLFNDMRFMQGRFESGDGRVLDATFAFT